MNKTRFRGSVAAILLGLAGSLAMLGNSLTEGTANAAVQWNDAAVSAILATGAPPTVASRALFIVHSAMYDAWAAYDPTAAGSIPGAPPRQGAGSRTDLNKMTAVSYAAYRTLLDLFPSQKTPFTMLMINLGFDPSATNANPTTAAGVGNAAAANQLAFRHGDGSNQLGDLGGNGPYSDYTGYQPVNTPDTVNDPNHWQPLRAANGSVQTFLSPFWGQVTPFALKAANQFRPGPPPQATTWLYQQRMTDTIGLSANLNDRAKVDGEYWNDAEGNSETPAGHWNRIAETLSDRDKNSLDRDVQMYFLLNAALHDVSVSVWEAKRYYDYIRPVSAIHNYFQGQQIQGWGGPGQGTVSLDGGAWTPWIPTPPHPEYPSDHSAYGNAAAEVLARFTGSDTYVATVTIAAGSSKIEPGVPQSATTLSWLTFSEVAEDQGFSRQTDGVHFKESVLRSAHMGRDVAGQVWSLYTQLVNGGGPQQAPSAGALR
jgi:hypothetical protein